MKFTGQPKHEKVNISIKYRDVFQDADLVDIFVKATTMLALAVGAARTKDTFDDTEAQRWAKEFLVGYGLLAIGEGRSILLLFSDGLNIHARIHFRALFEYEHKLALLFGDERRVDEKRVLAFRDSLAFELRGFAKRLGKTPEEIEAEIGRIFRTDDPAAVVGTKESVAQGGDVKSQMKDDLQPEKRYLGTFAWTS